MQLARPLRFCDGVLQRWPPAFGLTLVASYRDGRDLLPAGTPAPWPLRLLALGILPACFLPRRRLHPVLLPGGQPANGYHARGARPLALMPLRRSCPAYVPCAPASWPAALLPHELSDDFGRHALRVYLQLHLGPMRLVAAKCTPILRQIWAPLRLQLWPPHLAALSVP